MELSARGLGKLVFSQITRVRFPLALLSTIGIDNRNTQEYNGNMISKNFQLYSLAVVMLGLGVMVFGGLKAGIATWFIAGASGILLYLVATYLEG